MIPETPCIAFSYNYAADYDFVKVLAEKMSERGVEAWFLDRIVPPTDITTGDRLGGNFDWRREMRNWQATWLEGLRQARGIVVFDSSSARDSLTNVGRGMWRERAAVEFLRADDPIRVMEVVRPEASSDELVPGDLLVELIAWGREVPGASMTRRSGGT